MWWALLQAMGICHTVTPSSVAVIFLSVIQSKHVLKGKLDSSRTVEHQSDPFLERLEIAALDLSLAYLPRERGHLLTLFGLFPCSPRNFNMLIYSLSPREPPTKKGISSLPVRSYPKINASVTLVQPSCLRTHSYSTVRILVPEPSIIC